MPCTRAVSQGGNFLTMSAPEVDSNAETIAERPENDELQLNPWAKLRAGDPIRIKDPRRNTTVTGRIDTLNASRTVLWMSDGNPANRRMFHVSDPIKVIRIPDR
jgi:hypothetical protein